MSVLAERAAPLLVTGLPRSGTTWLAQLLARSPSTSMLGREPMNPRSRQWALAGEAREWTRWSEPPERARAVLRRTYRGRAPQTYGRLGVRQWRAALPSTRLVVKDPFALLSLPAVVSATGAVPVVVYRSADAVLASYRRMGWRPDVAELVTMGGAVPPGADSDDVLGMIAFWNWAHECVLADLAGLPGAVLVEHAELTTGSVSAQRRLLAHLRLDVDCRQDAPAGPTPRQQTRVSEHRLHNLDRSPEEVMHGWQQRLTPAEREAVLEGTAEVAARLSRARLRLA